MVTLAGCCAAATATTASTIPIPYRRLKRMRGAAQQDHDHDHQQAAAAGEEVDHRDQDHELVDDLKMRFRPGLIQRSGSSSSGRISEADDTVVLKVTMVGDCESGKSCFVTKYVSSDHEFRIQDYYSQTMGIVVKEKRLRIKNAQILFSIWELGGHNQFQDLLPRVCEGAAAVIFMFDLTKRSTLKSVKEWFVKTKQINSCAISVLVGTKYDQFVNYPQDIQLAITKQAMFYAETMGASLFYSSTTHNINVNKIFKVIVAKIFDLRCSISKNYNHGEPLVVY